MVQKVLLLAAAGALGTLARYGLSGIVQRFTGAGFPWGTLAVNVLGCLLAGCFWGFAEQRISLSAQARVVVLIGFMGAFTTFSAFVLETNEMLRDGEWLRAAGNITLQNTVGFVALIIGFTAGKSI
jgi:fluoride exporter